jgi:hypothetical protein
MATKKTCSICGKTFTANRSHADTCSVKCRVEKSTHKRELAKVHLEMFSYMRSKEFMDEVGISREKIEDAISELASLTKRHTGIEIPTGKKVLIRKS